MGAEPRYDIERDLERVRLEVLNGNPRRPSEPLDEGCPGGWYRCEFVSSVMPFRRRRTRDGLHDSNPRLNDSTDPPILEAIAFYEEQEAKAWEQVHRFANAQRR